MACGMLVPQPGTEPMTAAVEVWSPNHWTTREVPIDVPEEVKIRQGLTEMCCEHLWAWPWRMDRRGETASVKKGPPNGGLPLCIHSFPPSPPRPSEDTVNERTSSVCLGLCVLVQETVRNPGRTVGCQSEGKIEFVQQNDKRSNLLERNIWILERMGLRDAGSRRLYHKGPSVEGCDKDGVRL